MKDSNLTNSQDSAAPRDMGFSPWQRLKSKRISYLALPLLIMATVTEFVILATGWKYQQIVCLPKGMGVTFFGIGPIGATILAVELLKLPLAIWTASRQGWQKSFMLIVGLPLICVLTFQLVKDMAVYEMGTAMAPASELLEKAAAEETKMSQLNGELGAIEQKKVDRERKLAEVAAKRNKAKADYEESLKRNDETRQDAISLTDYQKKELSEVESRQATIIKQFDADAAQLTKGIADLRARREVELGRATQWNAEEARIENAYKAKMAEYTNKKTTYEKDKAEYDGANFVKRQILKEPVSPGVPPEREVNKLLKPTAIADIDAQVKTKEAELVAINNKRRERVAQVDADARRLREDFDKRSSSKRELTDTKREALAATQATLLAQIDAEEKQVDVDLAAAVKKVDGIRAEVDASRKRAEGFYEARETAIRGTQVHRIATTVEIVRGLFKGERPMSIKASAKERGDVLTDQISMVRIWVYPVLAFIVAFLPTLMVEIGFSTIFEPERKRPMYRLGFFGRRLHWLYTRAGRIKILRAERMANEASGEINAREKALATLKVNSEKALAQKEVELREAEETMAAKAAGYEELLKRQDDEHAAQSKTKEDEWVAKLAAMADSLNRTVVEKDSLRDLQKSEIERQIAMRQNAWSDRLTQLRQELDTQRTAAEAERTTLMQDHHKKLMELSEEAKTQVIQARRQMADAELAAVEKTAKLSHELKQALHARDEAEAQLKHQADALGIKMTQVQEDAAREIDKAGRQEKHRLERQQLEFDKIVRQREEDFERRLNQREQELVLECEARIVDEKTRAEQDSRIREAELERQLESRAKEIDGQWEREVQQRDDVAQIRLKQREQQLQTQADARLRALQTQSEEQLRRRELEVERQLDAQAREAENRLRDVLQEKELAFQAKLKERDQELVARVTAREGELKDQWVADLRAREEKWTQQSESRVRATESRLVQEALQKDEAFQLKLRQREQQLLAQFEGRQGELQAQWNQDLRTRDAKLAETKQREDDLMARLASQAEAHLAAKKEWDVELQTVRNGAESLKMLVMRTEKERDAALESAAEVDRQVQEFKKKSMEASTLLSTWNNGKNLMGGGRS